MERVDVFDQEEREHILGLGNISAEITKIVTDHVGELITLVISPVDNVDNDASLVVKKILDSILGYRLKRIAIARNLLPIVHEIQRNYLGSEVKVVLGASMPPPPILKLQTLVKMVNSMNEVLHAHDKLLTAIGQVLGDRTISDDKLKIKTIKLMLA